MFTQHALFCSEVWSSVGFQSGSRRPAPTGPQVVSSSQHASLYAQVDGPLGRFWQGITALERSFKKMCKCHQASDSSETVLLQSDILSFLHNERSLSNTASSL